MPGIRSTDKEMDDMELWSAELLSSREVTFTEFTDLFMAKFNKRYNTAVTNWKSAWKRLSKLREIKIAGKRMYRVTQLEYRYRELVKEGSHKDAANVLMNIAKLEGIDVNRIELDANLKAPLPLFNIDLNTGSVEETNKGKTKEEE